MPNNPPGLLSKYLGVALHTEIPLNHGECLVIVDGFVVFCFDFIPGKGFLSFCFGGDIAHEVLDEDGVLVGVLGDPFFVGALEYAVETATGALLDEVYQVLYPDRFVGEAHGVGDDAALVVCSVGAHRLGAGAECGDRNHDRQYVVDGAILLCLYFHPDFVVHQPFSFADGGCFHAEVGEFKNDMRFSCVQAGEHFPGYLRKRMHIQPGAVRMEYLHETAHVGSFVFLR